MPTCYPQGEHVQGSPVLLIFGVLLQLMATNALVIFMPHYKR